MVPSLTSGFIVCVFTVSSFAAATAFATSSPASLNVEQQRQDYLVALDALKAKDFKQFTKLLEREKNYLLYGYLQYEYLKDQIPFTPAATIRKFMDENRHAPISDMLRRKWLRYLAERGDWDTFLQEYPPVEEDTELRCYHSEHLLRSGKDQTVLTAEIEQLWLNGSKQPAACEPVFTAWHKAGQLSSEMVWARIKLAMERRNPGLASSLARYLPSKDQIWLERWLAMHREPMKELRNINYPLETPVSKMIVRHGVMRLAQKDPDVAMAEWQRLKQGFKFSNEDGDYVLRSVGILAAQDHSSSALAWLSAVSAQGEDEGLRHWRLRAAIQAGEWEIANYFIGSLSETEQKDSQWRYWKARVLEKLKRDKEARRLYTELAGERSYYGFLAADRIGASYSIQHVRVETNSEEVSAMLARPEVKLAQELFILGQNADARRQWAWATRNMNNHQLKVAAVIASRWGWHDRAILTVSKTDHLNDLDLRFPILYRDLVEESARENSIDSGWVYGVLRQESAFVIDARSDAGALGLMQLMPMTGRLTGRGMNLHIKNNSALMKIENNLRLGTRYLKIVLDGNDGHQVLATAAYNAGPNRVKEWLPETGALDADVWVENISFAETRNYVKNVLAFTTIYDYRLGNNLLRLQQRMPAVTPAKVTVGSYP